MNISSCEICQLTANGTGDLYTGTYWIASLARDQGYLGRSYVTLKTHKGSLRDLTQAEGLEYVTIVTLLERAGQGAFGAELFNWSCLMNNAYRNDSPEPHIHWHFRPRYKAPVAIGDKRFIDPNFGNHYDRDQRDFVEAPVLDAVRDQFKKHIDAL
jgi:diadenosine tetraphosphate (Ap4A) HIT family hydrolase